MRHHVRLIFAVLTAHHLKKRRVKSWWKAEVNERFVQSRRSRCGSGRSWPRRTNRVQAHITRDTKRRANYNALGAHVGMLTVPHPLLSESDEV